MVYIDYRKLIGFSNGSFVLTVPKSWVERHNLKKGDMMGVEENINQIIFYADTKEIEKKEKSISINTNNKKLSRIKAEIVTAYLNNYNTIEIFSNTLDDDARAIKGIIRNLSGMEIIEQTSNRIVAKDLIDVSSISIQSIIRRMDLITRSMMDDTILCLQGKCNPKSIVHRDVDINRLYYLGVRVIKNAMEDPMLMKKLKTTPWKLLIDKTILRRIEEIADSQKRVCRLIAEAEFEDKPLQEFKQLNEEIRERYSNAMKAYYNKDKEIAFDIEITHKNYIEKCNKFLEKAAKETCLYCPHVSSNTELTDSKKRISKGQTSFPTESHVSIGKIVEYTKATLSFINYIARTTLSID